MVGLGRVFHGSHIIGQPGERSESPPGRCGHRPKGRDRSPPDEPPLPPAEARVKCRAPARLFPPLANFTVGDVRKAGLYGLPTKAGAWHMSNPGAAVRLVDGVLTQMAKRMFVMLTVTMCIVAGLGFVKFQQIQTAMAEGAAFQQPPEAVTTVVAAEEAWPATLNVIGTMAAVQGVTVSADLPGTVERILFESGQAVRAGEVLAVLDTRQERAQLAGLEAQQELAKLTFDRMQGLLNERVISRAEFDRATAEVRQSDAQAEEIRAVIQRKTIRAPFTGILGLRQVNLGQYLAGGDALVTLQSLNPI